MVRFKNRYLLCHIDTEARPEQVTRIYKLETRDIHIAVRTSLSQHFGGLGIGQVISSLAVKIWSPALSLCLIRCSRDHYRTVWASLTLLTTLPYVGVVRFIVIHVGGTIRSSQKSAINHARQLVLEARNSSQDTKKLETATISIQSEMKDEPN